MMGINVFSHISWYSGFAEMIFQGIMKGKNVKRRWKENMKEWTDMDLASTQHN